MKAFRNTYTLHLKSNRKLTDKILKFISENFPNLKTLEIEGFSNITDAGILYLKEMQINSLTLSKCINILDEGLL